MVHLAQRIHSRPLSVVLLFLLSITSALCQVFAWGDNSFGQFDIPGSLNGKAVTAIAAGRYHTLALTGDGTVVAWGTNYYEQCDVPGSLKGKRVTAIAAGFGHSLALTSEGTVVAWGLNSSGECNVPTTLSGKRVTAISTSMTHNLAITSDGAVVAWGSNAYGQCEIPGSLAGKTVTAVAAGGYHSLALVSDGTVVGWGFNSYNACTIPDSLSGKTVKAVAAGMFHSLALTSDGTVVGWGNNDWGQCTIPGKLIGNTATAISAGILHSLAIVSDGTVAAWGYNDYGQCNVPDSLSNREVTAITGGFIASLCIAESPKPAPSFTTSQSTFTGGMALLVTGSLTLAKAAKTDVTFDLSSADPSVTVPSSIVVPAGTTKATFSLSSSLVDVLKTVKLTAKTATYPTATKTITVTPQIVTVSVNPSTFEGGTVGTGKVTLWTASATDTVVALKSSDARVDFGGATVSIPATQKSANFMIQSAEVAMPTEVDILARPGISKQAGIATITLTPAPRISSFTASRSTVYGNQKTTFTIKLASKPGAKGTTVTLEADGPGLGIPRSVFFPAGITSKSFDVFADGNAATGSVRFTATSGLSSAVGIVISVNQLKVTGSTLSAGTVVGGDPVLVTVNLNATVDQDTVITVASSNSAVASVPTSVKVPAGTKTVTYTLTTYAVTGRKTVTITAAKGGYTSTKALTVIP